MRTKKSVTVDEDAFQALKQVAKSSNDPAELLETVGVSYEELVQFMRDTGREQDRDVQKLLSLLHSSER